MQFDRKEAELTRELEDPRPRAASDRAKVKANQTARRQIEQLAEESAGSVFVVAGENELDGIYQRVAAELSLIYSLTYASTNTSHDGKFRKINVAVKQEGAVVRTHRGYVSR